MRDWYTQQEVAELLGVTKQTVYLYGKQGKIKKIPDPYRTHRNVRYEKAEVDELVAVKKSQPKGRKPSKVAKELGVSVQTIYRYIYEGLIDTIKVPFGDERTRHVITDEGFEQAREIINKHKQHSVQRYEYYDSQLDIALFQKYSSESIPDARITRNTKNEWVFYIPNTGEVIGFKEGLNKYEFKKSYPLHQEPLPYKGYAHVRVPKEYRYCYDLIDYLYQTWGIENVRLREEERIIHLMIKEGEKGYNCQIPFRELEGFMREGKWSVEKDKLIVRSAYRKTSVELPINIIKGIQEKAKNQDKTMSQLVEEAVEMYLKES